MTGGSATPGSGEASGGTEPSVTRERAPPAQSRSIVAAPEAGEIRPLERRDLARIAGLYELVMRSGSREPPPGLQPFFERTLLDHPWADPDIPSLVYEDAGGELLGFIGSHVRRFRFDGNPVRLAWTGPFLRDPSSPKKAVGALLMHRYLQGPQHATLTDGATEVVRRLMQALGGEVAHLRSLRWVRVLRPASFTADWLSRRLGRKGLSHPPALVRAVEDLVARRAVAGAAEAGVEVERLQPEALAEFLPSIAGRLRCYPDYDEPFARWLLHELERVKSREVLMASLVRDPQGGVAGWYVCFLPPNGRCVLLQLVASRGAAGNVIDHLFSEAHASGAISVEGRVEPGLLEALGTRRVVLRYWGATLIHSRSPDLLGALLSSRSLITNLDGESWMALNVEPFS